MDNIRIRSILQELGKRLPPASRLVLVGGGALALLGSPRPTLDLDFIGDDLAPSELDQTILRLARELKIEVDAVPLDRFIPLPAGSQERVIPIGQFGHLEVLVADPYSIALSKLDRGLDTDMDDLVFLAQQGRIVLEELERFTQALKPYAAQFDLSPAEMLARLALIRSRLGPGGEI